MSAEDRLHEIQADVMEMGKSVIAAMDRSIQALKKRDLVLAHKVIGDDAKINEKRFGIENKCIEILGAQKLEAEGLRVVVAVLNIITELERIGDYAAGIGRVTVMIGDEPPLKRLIDIPRMGEITMDMIDKSLQSFMSRDVEMVKKVVSMDSVVDALNDQVFSELLTYMMVDPKTINRATRLIWVSHNLERAADRATNICERVLFTVTGKMEEIGDTRY